MEFVGKKVRGVYLFKVSDPQVNLNEKKCGKYSRKNQDYF